MCAISPTHLHPMEHVANGPTHLKQKTKLGWPQTDGELHRVPVNACRQLLQKLESATHSAL